MDIGYFLLLLEGFLMVRAIWGLTMTPTLLSMAQKDINDNKSIRWFSETNFFREGINPRNWGKWRASTWKTYLQSIQGENNNDE